MENNFEMNNQQLEQIAGGGSSSADIEAAWNKIGEYINVLGQNLAGETPVAVIRGLYDMLKIDYNNRSLDVESDADILKYHLKNGPARGICDLIILHVGKLK